jgi:hypothetical protein
MTLDEQARLVLKNLVHYRNGGINEAEDCRLVMSAMLECAGFDDLVAENIAQASQLLAMKGALEEAVSFIKHISEVTGYPSDELAREEYDDKLARFRLSPTSAADKIAEGLRDAIAISGAPNSGGGDA